MGNIKKNTATLRKNMSTMIRTGHVGIWIYWMFYEHLSAHSLLAKLFQWGWSMRMRLAWKKSQKTLDTSKDYIKIRPEAPRVRAKDLIPNYWDCGLGKVQVRHAWRNLAEAVKNPWPGGAYNQVFNFDSPPDPRRRCSKFLNLNGSTAFCYQDRIF